MGCCFYHVRLHFEERKFVTVVLTCCSFFWNIVWGRPSPTLVVQKRLRRLIESQFKSLNVSCFINWHALTTDTLSTPRRKRGTWTWQPNASYIFLYSSSLLLYTHPLTDLSQTVNGRKLQFTYFVSQVCSHPNPLLRIYYSTLIRSKGLTEEALASIGYSDTIIFRPGLLAGVRRPEPRYAEIALRWIK
jgi:hypothetical protein